MRIAQVQNVRPGMVFTKDPSTRDRTTVRFMELRPNGCRNGVHINGNECWNHGYPVFVVSE